MFTYVHSLFLPCALPIFHPAVSCNKASFETPLVEWSVILIRSFDWFEFWLDIYTLSCGILPNFHWLLLTSAMKPDISPFFGQRGSSPYRIGSPLSIG